MQRKIRPLIEFVEPRTLFSTYTVNTLSDAASPGAGLLTLRQAVAAANAHGGADTINFAASLFSTSGLKKIELTQGEIDFTDATGVTTVNGPGAAKLAVTGQLQDTRIFDVALKASAKISGLTVSNGNAPIGSDTDGRGGGIYNAGSLTLSGVTVSNCYAGTLSATLSDTTAITGQGLGGGIYSSGALNLQNCTITGNSATGTDNEDGRNGTYGGFAAGGGIYSTAALTITSSTISNNYSHGGSAGANNGNDSTGGSASGGGIFSAGTLTVTDSTIDGNSTTGGTAGSQDIGSGGSSLGAGIYTTGSSTITGSSISDNNATGGDVPVDSVPNGPGLSYGGSAAGAGIYASAPLNITASSISGDLAVGGAAGEEFFDGYGGGASGGAIFASSTLTITSSTLTNDSAIGEDVGGDDFGESGGTGSGGAIYAEGSTTIQYSSITQNLASGGDAISWALGGNADGGGIFLQTSTLHLIDSTVADNTAQGGAAADDAGVGSINGGAATGGIYAATGTVRLINSTVADNVATGGAGSAVGTSTAAGAGGNAVGGIYSAQGMQIYDSTISGNSATGGAGGAASSTVPAGAHGTAVGGLSNPYGQGLLDNTIISANKANGAFNDIGSHVLSSSAYNLVGTGGGLTNGVNGNIVGVTNPKLSVLGNYGGPTQTMYPLAGSPALNAGSNALIPAGFTTDQRGLPRIVGGRVDIGSVEFSQIVITGSVYNDKNGDGKRETSEPGLAGWQVYVDLKDVGYYVAGDPTATTNSQGNYTITFSPITVPGNLIVREVVQTGWRRTQPAGAWPLGYYSISPTVGTAANTNFGDTA